MHHDNDDAFGFSTHYSWSPGMESSFVDPLLIQPHTSWRGTRGARVTFGAEEEAEAEEMLDELDAEMDEEFGRLYHGAEYHELDQASPADLGALIGRSGHSGYRGGRSSFGAAKMRFGPVEYEGSEWGALFLGAGALVVLWKGLGS